MPTTMLSSILAAVYIGYAGAQISTCALARTQCHNLKFTWCEERAGATTRVQPKFGTERPDGVLFCRDNDGDGVTVDTLKCYDNCAVSAKIRVGCFKKGNKWVPVPRTIDESSSGDNNAGTVSHALAVSSRCKTE